MRKAHLQTEMDTALKAAALFYAELNACLLESKNSGEPTRELGMKICEAEKSWMSEMAKYQIAFKEFAGSTFENK